MDVDSQWKLPHNTVQNVSVAYWKGWLNGQMNTTARVETEACAILQKKNMLHTKATSLNNIKKGDYPNNIFQIMQMGRCRGSKPRALQIPRDTKPLWLLNNIKKRR